MAEKALVLLSGGLDSATVAAIAKDQGYDLFALSFSYGQRHNHELECAHQLGEYFKVREHLIVPIDFRSFGGSALTDQIPVPVDRSDDEMEENIPVTYVPARNTVFLSLALAYAEPRGIRDIFIGVNAVDYSGYPDCRPEFIKQFEVLANLGTKAGVENKPFKVHAPLISLKKGEIIRKGVQLGVNYALTSSCYSPTDRGVPCGHCDSCLIREKGFREAGHSDPLLKGEENG